MTGRVVDVVVIVVGLLVGLLLGSAIGSERERYRAQGNERERYRARLGVVPPASARARAFVRRGAAADAVVA